MNERQKENAGLGGGPFWLAVRLAFGGWLGCAVLQLALYLRPAPHGGPFLAEWDRYFWLALLYDLLGVWLIAAPFLLLWLVVYRRPLHARAWRIVPWLQAALLAANLALSQLDHEVLRFLGLRLNPSFLFAYGQPELLGDRLFRDVLGSDRGGAWLPLALLLLVPAAYFWWADRRIRRARREDDPPARWLALALAILPLAVPANSWWQASSQFRLRKIEPLVIALAMDLRAGYRDWRRPDDFDRLAADYQRRWLTRSADPGWRFPDPDYPYLRVPAGAAPAAPPGPRWNIIYLQLETFRGLEMDALHPGARLRATPFLDRLAAGPDAALWAHADSFGMPSINGLFASHCSITPPRRRYITSHTGTALLCLPDLLRRHGYRAEILVGGDTDWDNSSPFLTAWYDRLRRFPQAEQEDRQIFRAAALDVKRLGRSGRPFFAAIASVSNHTPFSTREPRLDIAGQDGPDQRIRNTTHYMDDAVREFVEAISGEPWFAHTLIVIAGDHGFNTGEHGRPAGQQDLYRESIWVPLIIVGAHPRLPRGRHEEPASLLDIAPTLADLLGLRVANPWQGHSLLAVRPRGASAFAFREAALWDSPQWTAVRDPGDGRARLYRGQADWLQRRDLAATRPGLAERLLAVADGAQRLNDYLLQRNRVWPGRR